MLALLWHPTNDMRSDFSYFTGFVLLLNGVIPVGLDSSLTEINSKTIISVQMRG